MNQRLRIIVFVRHYLPGYKFGGPIRSIASMIELLGDEFDFSVIALDHDEGDDQPYPDVVSGVWTPLGKGRILYLSRHDAKFGALANLLRQTPHDAIYLAGAFDPVFNLRVLLMRRLRKPGIGPVVVAPQGVFSDGALRIKSWKKRSFLAMAHATGLYRDANWHVSSEFERDDVRRALGVTPASAPMHVAADLAVNARKTPLRMRQKSPDRLQVVFLSRICPKKNLVGALQILQSVAAPIDFHIYGPTEEEGYWRRCKQEMQKLPANVQARYHGPISPTEVPAVFQSADLFFLPTWGENFGHVILEALREGCPVLIANNTAFRNLESMHAGWDVPLEDGAAFRTILDSCASMPPHEWLAWSEGARKLAATIVDDPACLDAYREMFRHAAQQQRTRRFAA